MRPGRLDRILYIGPPDSRGREEILRIRTSKMSVEPGLDIRGLADLVSSCFLSSGVVPDCLADRWMLWR